MDITPININETRRQTGNQAWPVDTLSSCKIMSATIELKGLIQRDMGSQGVERANHLCNIIIGEIEPVRGLETAVPIGEANNG